MNQARHLSLALGACAAVVLAAGCQKDVASPPAGTITAGVKGGGCANFRLTGGGRVDKPEPQTGKNTPDSHDFATFGFQARPDKNCPFENAGSGQQEWNEHGENHEFLQPFAFHGEVTFFTATSGGTQGGQCGQYGGSGRIHFRDGQRFENVPFVVNHACDVAEPGVGRDHIMISIGEIQGGGPGIVYHRHSLLTGGNIQWHRLTGNN